MTSSDPMSSSFELLSSDPSSQTIAAVLTPLESSSGCSDVTTKPLHPFILGSFAGAVRLPFEGMSNDQIKGTVHELIENAGRANLLCADTPIRADGAGHLLGRAPIAITELSGYGKVVVKEYNRGGILSWFVRRTYLKMGSFRSADEFSRLEQVRSIGINAPEPVAWMSRGFLFYRAWLATKYVANSVTMVDFVQSRPDDAHRTLQDLTRQIQTLIRHKIFHVDLHPGNVIVTPEGKVFLLDFDKAVDFEGPLNALREHYILRWRRAVMKYSLSPLLAEAFCAGLRVDFSREVVK